MHTSGECSVSPLLQYASTGCVELSTMRTSIGQRIASSFKDPLCGTLSSALCDGSLWLNTFKRHLKTVIFSNSHEHHLAPLWRLAILAPLINITICLLIWVLTTANGRMAFPFVHKRGWSTKCVISWKCVPSWWFRRSLLTDVYGYTFTHRPTNWEPA